jgi:hypothetical protein
LKAVADRIEATASCRGVSFGSVLSSRPKAGNRTERGRRTPTLLPRGSIWPMRSALVLKYCKLCGLGGCRARHAHTQHVSPMAFWRRLTPKHVAHLL